MHDYDPNRIIGPGLNDYGRKKDLVTTPSMTTLPVTRDERRAVQALIAAGLDYDMILTACPSLRNAVQSERILNEHSDSL